MDTENTSGYSSIKTSPQSSDEDLLKNWRWSKIRLELKSQEFPLDFDDTLEENDENDPDVIEGEDFRPVVTPNEIEPHKEWYHKLLMFRMEFNREERGAFPPFPPPPLPSAMIAASCAVSVNSFEEAKRLASSHEFQSQSPASIALEKREHRFRPADFRPLPPPHVYLEMIRTLAPHQYIDLTYALAGAVLMDLGFRVPEHYPPLPPKIEPFRDLEAEEMAHMTEMSSQSSSEGEYSDASEHSRFIDKLKRRKNRERRAAREVRIAARLLSMSSVKEESDEEEKQKKETFSREHVYKEKTLATFIPRPANRRPPIPSFFCPPFHNNISNKRGPHQPPPPLAPMFLQSHLPYPMNPPLWLSAAIPPMLSPPETPLSPPARNNGKSE